MDEHGSKVTDDLLHDERLLVRRQLVLGLAEQRAGVGLDGRPVEVGVAGPSGFTGPTG